MHEMRQLAQANSHSYDLGIDADAAQRRPADRFGLQGKRDGSYSIPVGGLPLNSVPPDMKLENDR